MTYEVKKQVSQKLANKEKHKPSNDLISRMTTLGISKEAQSMEM